MRSLLHRLAIVLLAALALPASADDIGTPARKLSDYLDALNAAGQTVIYSSDLVTGEMLLSADPGSAPTPEELAEILQPFGLTVTAGAGDALLVVGMSAMRDDAAEAPAEPEQAQIPEIIVTPSMHRLDFARPATHTYLDRELVTRIPTTADEAVRVTSRLPGTAGGGLSTKTYVRGGEANEVLFLFDGLRLYEPYHLKDFQAIATIINGNALGGMDFYTGAYPARYGDRMSGVLNIELREPEKPVETELALSFFNTSLLSLGTFGGNRQGDWLVSARRGNLDLVVDVLDSDFGSPDYQDYLAHVGWELGPRTRFSANYLVSDDKLRLADPARYERATASYSNQIGWVKWQAEWSQALTSDSILAVSDITNRRVGDVDLPGIVSGSLSDMREFSVLELRQDWRWIVADTWMLRFGFNVKDLDSRYRFSSTRMIMPPFDTILDNESQTVRDFVLAPSGVQTAAYSELRWRPASQWTLDIGVRWDQQTYTTAQNDRQFSPRLNVLYQPSERTELRLGWGQYYQAQEINELQVSDGISSFAPAQQAEHAVLNLRFELVPGIDAQVSAYRKVFWKLHARFENSFNTLTLLPELQFDRVRIDPASAEAIGAEVTVTGGSPDEELFWWIGYTWSEIRDDFAVGEALRSWDQTHTLKGGLSWRWGKWDFSATAEAHTGWPKTLLTGELETATDGSEALVLDLSGRNELRHSRFHSLDVRVSRRFDLSRGALTAFLEVTNLYDRANPCCEEYSVGPDGSLVSRDKHWLPLTPSLGVIWRF